jgi:hypothetical protein
MLGFLRKVAALLVRASPVASAQLDSAGLELLSRHRTDNGPQDTSFYFYFPRIEAADRVAELLRREQFAVTVSRAAVGQDWLVFAERPMEPQVEVEALRPRFEALAKAEGGEYDGWEVAIRSS